ncbi:hypothetical protein [Streptantibioticus ferralitis]|uniref:DUF2171 domain-containing protein n=1 Tax=Streptantibioticus ferralitis TaxID=236510 RepID=A0ABT5ZBK2_9ACTN|nr:hypothetical protein [Streptantibioticus ferralitis]MDF2260926.1 hypothetical protein [Streptantibioticus ferralitis]
MSNSRAQIGDLVHDEERGCQGVVTDIRGGRLILRPVAGSRQEWEPSGRVEIRESGYVAARQ